MIYMFIAEGFEETEAVATADVLLRAGLDVKTVGIGGNTITGAHGLSLVCDWNDSQIKPEERIEAIVLPGGMPDTTNLMQSSVVKRFIEYAAEKQIWICAICAAPSILGRMGLLKGIHATCFPGFEQYLEGAVLDEAPVCKDGLFITAKGPGVATSFGLEIVRTIVGPQKAAEVAEAMQCVQ